MPIPKEQFERGLSDTEMRILEVLRQGQELAFNLTDILDKLRIDRRNLGKAIVAAFAFNGVLDNMVTKGLVLKKEISGGTYYMIKK